ncbi:unnamed protein product [Brassica rapa subsp. narinosa]
MEKTGQSFTPLIVNIAHGEVMIFTNTDYFQNLIYVAIRKEEPWGCHPLLYL